MGLATGPNDEEEEEEESVLFVKLTTGYEWEDLYLYSQTRPNGVHRDNLHLL